MFSWGMAPVFIRLLRNAYDPYSQSFIRYFLAALILSTVCMVMFRTEFLALLRKPGPLIGIAAINTLHQITWTLGCYRASATLAQLILQSGIIFVILFSFMFFHEERRVIRSALFLVGTVAGFVGMAAVLMGGGHSAGSITLGTAILLLIPSLCWAIYVVWAKHLVMNCHPVPMFTVLSIFISIGAGLLACVFGRPACLVEASGWTTFVAFLSALFPLALAHPSFHFAQKHLGSAFSSSCNLFTPLVTYVLAKMTLDDTPLTLAQWIGGAVLLSGMTLVMRARARAD